MIIEVRSNAFGDVTTYSWSGLDPLKPIELDYAWGEWWHLPALDRAGQAVV